MNTTSQPTTVHPAVPTSVCIDCGHPTYCDHPHGSDPSHDHSPEARACTAAALAAA